MDLANNSNRGWLKVCYLVFAFCSALFLGVIKGFLVGPIASLILIIGNIGVIIGMLPSHVVWTIYTLVKIKLLDQPFKAAMLLLLPSLFVVWLGLSIGVSVLVGIGYGFFTPWVSTFEAFRHENDHNKFLHCAMDGTWETIKGSCTVVRDFGDLCYHSYPIYLKELRESPSCNDVQPLRLIHVPACIVAGLIGVLVEIPLYTVIAVVKSPYMLFKGWFRLIHDLISREGLFLETACIPIAGLTILMWPIIVIMSISFAIFSGLFIGLYASVIVYQERSFRKGLAYVIAMVAEFDEYTNDWLYLSEGTVFPKPQYRKASVTKSPEPSVRDNNNQEDRQATAASTEEAPAMLVPSLARSRSFRETIQEVKMVQVWGNMMRSSELRGKELLDANVLTMDDLNEWLKAKNSNEAAIVDVGLPCYSLLLTLVHSIKANSSGVLLLDDVEVTHANRPQDKLLDWFFGPVMVLKEQIRALMEVESEVRFLEKVVLFGGDTRRIQGWDNGGFVPQSALRAAQIQGISRRMAGMARSVSKFPTYRRMYRQVVKDLVTYYGEKEASIPSNSVISIGSIENV